MKKVLCLTGVVLFGMGLSASAALIASESFWTPGAYESGQKLGELTTGQYTTTGNYGFISSSGWLGGSAWMTTRDYAGLTHSGATGTSLAGGVDMLSVGGSSVRLSRRKIPSAGITGTEMYFSGLVSAGPGMIAGSVMQMGMSDEDTLVAGSYAKGFFIGLSADESANVFLTAYAGGNVYTLGSAISAGDVYQIVLKAELGAGSGDDTLTAWYAADGATELTLGTTVSNLTIADSAGALDRFVTRIYFGGTKGTTVGGNYFDEMRFGTTLGDVTSIPEPATFGRFGMSLASVTAIGNVAPSRLVSLDDPRALTDAEQFLEELPFSFVFGGNSGRELLATWEHEVELFSEGGREGRRMRWRDPETGLRVTCELTLWPEYEASEWVVYFENTGVEDTPILEDIQGLDLAVSVPSSRALRLRRSRGCTSGKAAANRDFLPFDVGLNEGTELKIDPSHPNKRFAGRSSEGALPFFNLDWEDGGIIGAIGWSGMWELTLERADGLLHLAAGQQTTHLRLRPGERVRTPRMLLLRWEGTDRMAGHNQFRRLMLDHYVPRIDGEVAVPPVSYRKSAIALDKVNETNQLEVIEEIARFEDFEAYWLDAGWYGEDGKSWPNNRGSWVPKPGAFPRGVKTVGDAARAHGLGFVLWFEPETVAQDSIVAREHPEFLLGPASRSLFNLGNPEARKWMTDLISKHIEESGVTILRIDYNFTNPLSVWRAADAPDRQGITENFYIQGLYEQWDEWLRRHPGLAIDNVASGGRRIDLETISRSYSLWRSDSQNIYRPRPVEDQVQTAGLSLYVPLHAAGTPSFEPYAFRSVATMGLSARNVDLRALSEEEDKQVRRMLAQTKMLRPLWLGDYYPLFEISADESAWCGWQFHRPDLGKGFATVFRREDSPNAAAEVELRALDPQAEYKVWFVDEDRHEVLTGAQLQRWLVELGSQGSSWLMIYEQQAK